MKISWGIKITMLYAGFVLLIAIMVITSSRQHFDLVSDSYYADEIAYQKVIDAGKNQSLLSHPVYIHANESTIILDLPPELKDKSISGSVYFYSSVNAAWDKRFGADVINNSISIPRTGLHRTRYTVKIDMQVAGKTYYQESQIDLGR